MLSAFVYTSVYFQEIIWDMSIFDLLTSEFFILSNWFTYFQKVFLQQCYDIFQLNRML